MTRQAAILLLALAALLEAGGDAVIRIGLGRHDRAARFGLFVAGAVILFLYGYAVNSPPWRFGELLGLYIVFFFVIAQFTSWVVFGQRPTTALLIGGVLIVAGGVVIAMGRA